MKLLNFNIAPEYPELSLDKKMVINTINPHSYCVACKDEEFALALRQSDVLVPDGVGIVWAARVLKGQRIQKIAGYDVFTYVMNHLNSIKGTCFFLGASENTLELIKNRVKLEYPNVKVHYHSPPYRTKFSSEENQEMHRKVNASGADALFVGMTAPKQEKWVLENQNLLKPDLICTIGAVFDFYAGTVKRSHPFWIKLGLEWLPRFLRQPKRLAERNLVSTPKFILEVFSFKFFKKGFL